MDTNESCALVDNLRDLEKTVREKDRVIALVYASWCPFCRRFLPIFQQYAQEERRHFLRIQDDRESVGEKYSVDVFPTVLFFEKGTVSKRLDGEPGVGLSEKQLADFVKSCPLPENN